MSVVYDNEVMSVVYISISCAGYTNISQRCKRNIKYCKYVNLHRASYWLNEGFLNLEAAAASFEQYEQ